MKIICENFKIYSYYSYEYIQLRYLIVVLNIMKKSLIITKKLDKKHTNE